MELVAYGFALAGEWHLSSTVQSGITFRLNAFASDRVIYAFVVGDQCKYIGICEKNTTTLQNRMGRYKSRQGGSTNRRIAHVIRECLASGEGVQIFALRPKDGLRYEDLPIDLVKGLENPFIDKFKPEWNR